MAELHQQRAMADDFFLIAGGKIHCRQCSARSKRTKNRCQAPAMRTKSKCRFHGGKSTGARTAEGKLRAKQARTIHGNSTRAARLELSQELLEIQRLRVLAYLCGLVETLRGPGRPPGRRRTT